MGIAVATDRLEDHSLWHHYKTRVWNERGPQAESVHNIARIVRAIRNKGRTGYPSVPVSSGKYLYDAAFELHFQADVPLEHAVAQLKRDAFNYNLPRALNFVDSLQDALPYQLISPADFNPNFERTGMKWEQDHFMGLWLTIIGENVTDIHCYNKEGFFSDGMTEEAVSKFQLELGLPKHPRITFYNTKEDEKAERERMRNVRLFDWRGEPLTLNDVATSLDHSISYVTERGFTPSKLIRARRELEWTGEMLERGFYQ